GDSSKGARRRVWGPRSLPAQSPRPGRRVREDGLRTCVPAEACSELPLDPRVDRRAERLPTNLGVTCDAIGDREEEVVFMSLSLDRSLLLKELIQIGIGLTSERELASLPARILTEARRFTNAEAGTLYLRDGHRLRFTVVQNDVLERRLG